MRRSGARLRNARSPTMTPDDDPGCRSSLTKLQLAQVSLLAAGCALCRTSGRPDARGQKRGTSSRARYIVPRKEASGAAFTGGRTSAGDVSSQASRGFFLAFARADTIWREEEVAVVLEESRTEIRIPILRRTSLASRRP